MTAPILPNENEIIVTITLPDVITAGMWETYSEGRASYAASRLNADLNITRYYGACALYNAGHVVVSGLPVLTDALKAAKHTTVDLVLVGAIVDYIAIPMEQAINRPLQTYLRKSSPTASIRVNGIVQEA